MKYDGGMKFIMDRDGKISNDQSSLDGPWWHGPLYVVAVVVLFWYAITMGGTNG
jgi:hypothetical protein